MYISKSTQDGYLGKQELLKEIKDRLRRNNLKIEDIEAIIKDYYEQREDEKPKCWKCGIDVKGHLCDKCFKDDDTPERQGGGNY